MNTTHDLPGDRRTIDLDHYPATGPGGLNAPDPRFVAVGEGSTELIPRVWAERILGELRSAKPAVWRSLVGRASTAGASSGEG